MFQNKDDVKLREDYSSSTYGGAEVRLNSTSYREQRTRVSAPERRRFTPHEQDTECARQCDHARSSDDPFETVAPQLVAVFQALGCTRPVADELAQKVTGEVRARTREVLRRPGLAATWISGVIQVGALTLDLERHIFWRGGNEIHLSPKEFDLVALMMMNTDVLLPHAKLLRSVWGPEYGGELEYLRTYVYTLRRKIETNPANPQYILNEPRIGYRFRNPTAGVSRFGAAQPRPKPQVVRAAPL